jgi:hypothetical protein
VVSLPKHKPALTSSPPVVLSPDVILGRARASYNHDVPTIDHNNNNNINNSNNNNNNNNNINNNNNNNNVGPTSPQSEALPSSVASAPLSINEVALDGAPSSRGSSRSRSHSRTQHDGKKDSHVLPSAGISL